MHEYNVLQNYILNGKLDEDFFLDSSKISIYRSNYFEGLIQALQNKFHVLFIILGEDNFKFFAKEYINSHPSKHESVDFYGDDFYLFLKARSELKEISYLEQMGMIDLLLYQSDEGKSLLLQDGTLKLWSAFKENKSIKDIEISEEKKKIYFKKDKFSYYLVQS